MDISTLTAGTTTVPYMALTTRAMACAPPVLTDNFRGCRVPGDVAFWESGGFYSPGNCFRGYRALCTQTTAEWWPIRDAETVVRCIPDGFGCNAEDEDQRYATSEYDGTTLSAPAFEIRWRDSDRTLYHHGETTQSSEWLSTTSTPSSPGATTSTPGKDEGTVHESAEEPDEEGGAAAAQPQQHRRVSKGTMTGIAIGALLGLMFLLAAAVYCSLRRQTTTKGDGRKGRIVRGEEGFSVMDEDFWEQDGHFGGHPSSSLGQGGGRLPAAELDNRTAGPKELPADDPAAAAAPTTGVGDGDGKGVGFRQGSSGLEDWHNSFLS
ncbi:hypothetical protein N3K66_008491 [Trichothecium roseum]|uniref:Uncharacterized protein n=1 Tax=Trichothecium roseum TaxID=47278 RepID=A0ACC0US19_9HYPO|nr:hypothetical protein N3K66_008491 [Trichothecium roseum]